MYHSRRIISIVAIVIMTSNAAVFAKENVIAKIGNLSFLEPIDHVPDYDKSTFQYKDTGNVSGEIAYTRGNYIIVRMIKDGEEQKVRSLPIKNSSILYDVQVSPDGRRILFKNGVYGDYYDTHNLYYWDLKEQHVYKASKNSVAYQKSNWSPSGRYIAYCLGGDMNGSQYGVPNVNRPLRLYAYDTKTHQNQFIAQGQGVVSWKWGGGDYLYYSHTKDDRKWVEGGDNKALLEGTHSRLKNIYRSSPKDGSSELILEGAQVQTISPDGEKLLVSSHFDPNAPEKEVKIFPYERVSYAYQCLYDAKAKDLQPVKGLKGILNGAEFLKEDKILSRNYVYQRKTGTLYINMFDLNKGREPKNIATVSEEDSEPSPNRASFQPQFSNFTLSKDNARLFFSSRRTGEKLGRTKTGATKYIIPIHFNMVNLKTGERSIICQNRFMLNFSWGPIFKEAKND